MSAAKIIGIAVKTATIRELAHGRPDCLRERSRAGLRIQIVLEKETEIRSQVVLEKKQRSGVRLS